MFIRRDAGVQPCQQGWIVQRRDLGQGLRQQIERRIRLAAERRQGLSPVLSGAPQPVKQPALRSPRFIGRRQPGQGQSIVCLEGRFGAVEKVTSFGVDQPRRLHVEIALRIGRC
ncbi:hypothetical protein FQZ97_1094500 [compost metagenome]